MQTCLLYIEKASQCNEHVITMDNLDAIMELMENDVLY